MNLDDLKSSATKKLGPLPAWGWVAVAGGGYYYYEKRKAAAAGTTAAATATAATADPNAGTTLTPGESIVNPDGSLTTAPGGSGSTGTSTSDTTDPNANLETAISALQSTIDGMGNTGNNGQQSSSTPPVINITNKIPSAVKAVAKKVTKRTPKPKKAKVPTKKPATAKKPAGSKKVTKPRLPAKVRSALGGRMAPVHAPTPATSLSGRRTVSPTASAGTRVRARPLVSLVGRTSPVQHTVATHPKAPAKPLTGSPPRPSAPPPRAAGRPIVKPAPKPVRKRA
jgi:hypothetical protein